MSRPLAKMFAVWMVVGSGALAAVSWLDQDKPKTVVAAAEPSLPCKEQAWPMIDRKCLKWTAPAKTPVAAAAPEPARVAVAVAIDAIPQGPEVTPAEPLMVELAKPEPLAVEPAKAEPLRAEPVKVEAAKLEPVRAEPAALRPSLEPLPAVPRAHRPAARSNANGIHVVSRSANGAPRTIVVRPTNPQDALYYAARRDIASFGPHGLRR